VRVRRESKKREREERGRNREERGREKKRLTQNATAPCFSLIDRQMA
jgi:hypothetical protein